MGNEKVCPAHEGPAVVAFILFPQFVGGIQLQGNFFLIIIVLPELFEINRCPVIAFDRIQDGGLIGLPEDKVRLQFTGVDEIIDIGIRLIFEVDVFCRLLCEQEL